MAVIFIVILTFAFIAAVPFLYNAWAVTPTAAIEPENSTLSSQVTTVDDATSSNGRAVQFGNSMTMLLRWQRPTLDNPTTLIIPETGDRMYSLTLGKDYIVKFATGVRRDPIEFNNARNIVIVGCEMNVANITSPNYWDRRYIKIQSGITGTVHIEGCWLHGTSLIDGIVIDAPNAIVQIQNSLIEGMEYDELIANHPDILQTYAGPRELRMYNVTGASDYQGIQVYGESGNGNIWPDAVTLDRVNVRPNTTYGNLNYEIPLYQNAPYNMANDTKWLLNDVYLSPGYRDGSPTARRTLRASLGYSTEINWYYQEYRANGTVYGTEQQGAGSASANTQGDYIVFTRPSTDRLWNIEQTAGGRIYYGIPSGGDYVKSADVGRNYSNTLP